MTINLGSMNATINTITATTITANQVPNRYSHCSINAVNLTSGGTVILQMTQYGGKNNLLNSSTTFSTANPNYYYIFNVYLLVDTTGGAGYLRLILSDTNGSPNIHIDNVDITPPNYYSIAGSGIIQGGLNGVGTVTLQLYASGTLAGSVIQGYVTCEEFVYGAT